MNTAEREAMDVMLKLGIIFQGDDGIYHLTTIGRSRR